MKGKEGVDTGDLEEARDRVRFGREKSGRVMDEKEKQITAYHEAGHTIVGAMHPGVEPLHKVTIIPRGRALGVTMQLPEDDKHTYPRQYLINNLAIMMGGRVAEQKAIHG